MVLCSHSCWFLFCSTTQNSKFSKICFKVKKFMKTRVKCRKKITKILLNQNKINQWIICWNWKKKKWKNNCSCFHLFSSKWIFKVFSCSSIAKRCCAFIVVFFSLKSHVLRVFAPLFLIVLPPQTITLAMFTIYNYSANYG